MNFVFCEYSFGLDYWVHKTLHTITDRHQELASRRKLPVERANMLWAYAMSGWLAGFVVSENGEFQIATS